MAGLVPAIHVFTCARVCKAWMPGTRPGMTTESSVSSAMAQEPRVFTIPASAPFLPTLIEALLQDRLGLGFKPDGDPLSLATATIYLPAGAEDFSGGAEQR